MPRLELRGSALYYEIDVSPEAPALLLLHAGIAQLRMWDSQIDALSRDHFVVRFDQRGFGLTDSKTDDSETVAYSDRADAIALLDHLGIATATVIGCSRGGMIAIDLAI